LQVLVYACYLAAVLFFFLRAGRRAKTPAAPAAPTPSSPAPSSAGPVDQAPASTAS